MASSQTEKWKAPTELAGAVAVLIGLVFVGLELRQNTAAVEAATFQSLTDASNDYILAIASDPDVLRAWSLGSADPDQLDELDSARYTLVMRAYWVRMQNVYSQWQRGTLSDEDWHLYDAVICGTDNIVGGPYGERATFDQHTAVLSPIFVEFVKSCWNKE